MNSFTVSLPVPSRPSPLEPFARRACASILALSLASLMPAVVRAAPPSAPDDATPGEADEQTTAAGDATGDAAGEATGDATGDADLPDEAAVRSALADGDLTTARELAVARSSGDPSPENFVLEAQVWQALGDYENAKRAYASALERLSEAREDERAQVEQELAALEEASRGTRADEPASTERARIDRERAERLAALAPKPPPPEVVDKPKPVPITKKWYFWVTLGAIVGSAGAIVGLAASSATSEIGERKSNASAAARQPVPVGGLMLRF